MITFGAMRTKSGARLMVMSTCPPHAYSIFGIGKRWEDIEHPLARISPAVFSLASQP